MPTRLGQGIGNDTLAVDGIYHVYNCTIDGISPFSNSRNSSLFLKLVGHYNKFNIPFSEHLSYKNMEKRVLEVTPVEILSYCIMPNHYHLLIKQLSDNGISKYLERLSKSFTHIYNKDANRIGTLWLGRFKAKLVDTDEAFLQVSRYIHLNPIVSTKLNIRRIEEYPWSSYLDAIGKRDNKICNHELLWGLIKPEVYEKFVSSKINTIDRFEKRVLEVR
ncbi:hypothetical protein CO050_05470 [Candidatus Roizmanbacteria bacterium CG_4_9_14_0_2_um_filter_38_17]|nr:MAG: hypothetical protein CO050_05470 [Candidatus Roizmanbacteria bacterium CG_4_9_14_0_2_um_filter_38_17]